MSHKVKEVQGIAAPNLEYSQPRRESLVVGVRGEAIAVNSSIGNPARYQIGNHFSFPTVGNASVLRGW